MIISSDRQGGIALEKGLATDTWVKAGWEEFIVLANDSTYADGRFYYHQGLVTSSPTLTLMGTALASKPHDLAFLVFPLRDFGTWLGISSPASTPAQAVSILRLSSDTDSKPRNNTI